MTMSFQSLCFDCVCHFVEYTRPLFGEVRAAERHICRLRCEAFPETTACPSYRRTWVLQPSAGALVASAPSPGRLGNAPGAWPVVADP